MRCALGAYEIYFPAKTPWIESKPCYHRGENNNEIPWLVYITWSLSIGYRPRAKIFVDFENQGKAIFLKTSWYILISKNQALHVL